MSMLLVGVLSSCDNNPYYENTEPSDIEGFGKTYLYVEQYPVEGLEYECGYLDRAFTDNYGGFVYELGTSCRFYLNEREFFSISSTGLRDGGIHELNDDTLTDILYQIDTKIDPNKIVINN